MIYRFMRIIVGLGCSLALGACQPQQQTHSAAAEKSHTKPASKTLAVEGTDVRDAGLGGHDFTLLGPDGQPIHLSQFKGKVVALVFGYTHCPDVCPTNLLAYADALGQLGPRAQDVQVLFVTVDPERDTITVMKRYAPAFHPTFIGLTVDRLHQADLDKVMQQYKVVSRKVASDVPGQYMVDHSTGTYLIDRNGQTAVYEPHSQTATQLAHDIKILLD